MFELKCKHCGEDAVFLCARCKTGLCWNHARLEIVCGECTRTEKREVAIRRGRSADKIFVRKFRKILLLSDDDIEELFKNVVLIAEVNGKAVGFIVFTQQTKEEGWLNVMGVLPQYQRLGIGTGLLDALVEISKKRKIKKLHLTTSNENVPGLMFYMKNGFKIVRVRRDAYRRYGICGFGVPGYDELKLELMIGDGAVKKSCK